MTTLQRRIEAAGDVVAMLRNAPSAAYPFPVAPQFTTWIEEIRAWRETAALLDQSYHMTELRIAGPDAVALLSHAGVNSFAGFGRDRAKQLVCCSPDGYVIGDGIVFGLEDDVALYVGRPPLANWLRYLAETGDWDVAVDLDARSPENPDAPRRHYRFEVQGPNALAILNAVNEGDALTTRFFAMGQITVAGCAARTLCHGMGGAKGLEIWGPFADREAVLARLIEVGEAHGLRRAGARAYSMSAVESGWIPSPLPAIYSGEAMRPYREWLPATGFEATTSVGGSYVPDTVDGYYLTPWDLDYGRLVKFDHDFVGRDALQAMADGPHRRKVTLVWDRASVLDIVGGAMEAYPGPKMLEWPAGQYAAHPYDQVFQGDRTVGLSTYPAYSPNERAWLSLAILEPGAAETGARVEVLWGEPDGGTAKPHVERHRQIRVGAQVQPWPIHEAARQTYRSQT